MGNFIDLTGRKFGRLTALRRVHGSDWAWRCTCGVAIVKIASAVKSGNTRSCGCLRRETTAQMAALKKTHGRAKTRVYRCWTGMLQRCSNPNVENFHNYGGRGINVCKRWLKFENFYADMGDPPKKMSLERVNNNGGYNPSNCIWACVATQSQNRRTNVFIKINGEKLTIAQAAIKFKINYQTLYYRIKNNWGVKRALGQS